MNKSRKISLINIITSLALIALEAVGVYFFATNPENTNGFDVMDLKYYTVLTIFVTLLGSVLMIWANIVSFAKKRDCTPRIFYSIRFLSAVMSLITLVTVAVFIAPTGKGAGSSLDVIFNLESGFLFMHFICPIVSVFQFIFLEIEPKGKFRKTFEPLIATIIYGSAILITIFVLKAKDVQKATEFSPYFFFWVTDDLIKVGKTLSTKVFPHPENMSQIFNICVLVGVVIISYVIAVFLWLLNRLSHNIFVGETYEVSEPKAKKKKGAASTRNRRLSTFVRNQVAFGNKSSTRPIYHISLHDRRLKTWRIKTENSSRALKVFPTQKDAINYANQCIRKNGGSIRIHSMTGKIRQTKN